MLASRMLGRWESLNGTSVSLFIKMLAFFLRHLEHIYFLEPSCILSGKQTVTVVQVVTASEVQSVGCRQLIDLM